MLGLTGLAVITAAGSIGVLRHAWRKPERHWPMILSGWGLLLVSMIIWSYITGADKGVALAFVTWVIVALLFLLNAASHSERRPARMLKKQQQALTKPGLVLVAKRVFVALLMGPGLGLIAMAICTAAFTALASLGTEHTANLTIVSFSFPLVWAALAVMLGYQRELWLKTCSAVGLAGLAFGYLWVSM